VDGGGQLRRERPRHLTRNNVNVSVPAHHMRLCAFPPGTGRIAPPWSTRSVAFFLFVASSECAWAGLTRIAPKGPGSGPTTQGRTCSSPNSDHTGSQAGLYPKLPSPRSNRLCSCHRPHPSLLVSGGPHTGGMSHAVGLRRTGRLTPNPPKGPATDEETTSPVDHPLRRHTSALEEGPAPSRQG
jgi:hypothetical protein